MRLPKCKRRVRGSQPGLRGVFRAPAELSWRHRAGEAAVQALVPAPEVVWLLRRGPDRAAIIDSICNGPLSAGLRGIFHFHFVIKNKAKIHYGDAHDDEYRRDYSRFDQGRARPLRT